eukprot:605151-Amphidinium_carterae.1
MKSRDLRHLQQGFDEREIRQRENKVQSKDMQDLYIIISESILQQWMTTGTIPPKAFDNGTDEKHGHYNFHKRIEYTIGDFVNLCDKTFYLAIIHTTMSIKGSQIDEQIASIGCYGRLLTTSTKSTEIDSEGLQRTASTMATTWGLRATYKQTKTSVITNRDEYKQRHFHDFSIITTEEDLNED